MGYYIDHSGKRPLPPKGKLAILLEDVPGAEVLNLNPMGLGPQKWVPNLVAVAHNPTFEAAAYAFDEEEMRRFADVRDPRRIDWAIIPGADVLSGYKRRTTPSVRGTPLS
jgi:hypothetical protein